MREQRLPGKTASPGFAIGPLALLRHDERVRQAGSIDDEAAAFAAAIQAASGDIKNLMDADADLAADILEFQLELLDDDDLLEPVRARINAGDAADHAWSHHLDGEIDEYRAMDDDYMAARASDLVDLQGRVTRHLRGEHRPVAERIVGLEQGSILLADDLAPSAFMELAGHKLAGIALTAGHPTSHAAILARARGVAMIVSLGDVIQPVPGTTAILDDDDACLITNPSQQRLLAARQRITQQQSLDARADAAAHKAAATASGVPVQVMVNLDDPGLLDELDPAICDGAGLVRTEFLFQGGLADEERQYQTYRRIMNWAAGRPVTFRTIDAGGDKPVPGLTNDGETNPFLGLRGLRLSLAKPAIFKIQLRALLRAAGFGSAKIMLPMVTASHEFDAAKTLMEAVAADLAASSIDHAKPALGIMVETPAAALTAADFDADFYSIGSNDLIQYVTATARDNPSVADLADPRHPAVLALIKQVADVGRTRGVEVSLCGDMASDPDLVPLLIERGLRTLSVAPAQIGRIKLAIGGIA